MSFFLPATLAVLQEKMEKGHPFIAELRKYHPDAPDEEKIVWLSDFRGSFEEEYPITKEDDWHSIQFEHNGKAYCADVNVWIGDNGNPMVSIHAVTGEPGAFKTDGSSFIKVEVKETT